MSEWRLVDAGAWILRWRTSARSIHYVIVLALGKFWMRMAHAVWRLDHIEVDVASLEFLADRLT